MVSGMAGQGAIGEVRAALVAPAERAAAAATERWPCALLLVAPQRKAACAARALQFGVRANNNPCSPHTRFGMLNGSAKKLCTILHVGSCGGFWSIGRHNCLA